MPSAFIFWNTGDSAVEPDVHEKTGVSATSRTGCASPIGEYFRVHVYAAEPDQECRKAQRRRSDPACVVADLSRGALGDVGAAPPHFTAEQGLDQPQSLSKLLPSRWFEREEVQRNVALPINKNGDQECVLASHQVADPAEDDGA